ncbi:MAG: isoprenylcysteine carboxylmethyltransferase family protein [Dehalococcoidia bacterium]
MLSRLLVCALMGGGRLAELAWSRRNMGASGMATEGPWSRRTYPLIVALHAGVIVGTALFGGQRRRWWLTMLLLAQPLRAWVLLTLGERWNTRAAVPAEMTVATDGPYAFVRHPNYTVIGIELAALPLAFGLPRLALGATVANAAALAARIPEEEAALRKLPGWEDHFAGKKRFIPGVW